MTILFLSLYNVTESSKTTYKYKCWSFVSKTTKVYLNNLGNTNVPNQVKKLVKSYVNKT
jgi:hypothetical protein